MAWNPDREQKPRSSGYRPHSTGGIDMNLNGDALEQLTALEIALGEFQGVDRFDRYVENIRHSDGNQGQFIGGGLILDQQYVSPYMIPGWARTEAWHIAEVSPYDDSHVPSETQTWSGSFHFTGESFHPSAYETPRSRWYKYVTVGLGALATAAVGGIRAAGADEAQRASADTGLRPSTSETIAAGESRVAQRNESAAVSVRPESTALAQIDISKTPRL